MSAMVETRPVASARADALKVTQSRVVVSEWTKFRSLRSTVWTLITAVTLLVGIGALFAYVEVAQYDSLTPADLASFNPITVSLNGIAFAQLAIGVLGVMLMSSEYSTGMIRSSLTAVPRRLPVLWGKLLVFSGIVFGVSVVASFAAFFAGQAVLDVKGLGVSITAPDALRSIVGAALYLTVAGLIGIALGALLRNTAAGISTFVGVFFVLPPLLSLLSSSITSHFAQYLPSNAGQAVYGSARTVSDPLSPWAGFGVLCLYAVVLVGIAAWRLARTDA